MSGFPDLPQDLTILQIDVARMNLCSQNLLDEPVYVGRFGGEDIRVLDLEEMVMVEYLNLCSATTNL
jgi:hypothetical protein